MDCREREEAGCKVEGTLCFCRAACDLAEIRAQRCASFTSCPCSLNQASSPQAV